MTNAQTEARAIALEVVKGVFGTNEAAFVERRVTQLVATALAAKDAELTRLEHVVAYESGEPDALKYHKALFARLDRVEAQLAEANKALERHRSERSYVVGWNDGFAHATSEDLKFPTMLRKMWSGGEVQAWLDEQFAARRALEPAASSDCPTCAGTGYKDKGGARVAIQRVPCPDCGPAAPEGRQEAGADAVRFLYKHGALTHVAAREAVELLTSNGFEISRRSK